MRRFACLMLCLFAGAAVARATVLVPIEFRALVSSAPVIVHGRVATVRAQWADGRRSVDTFVTVDAMEYLRGNMGSQITFRVPGGQIGRYRTVFVGAPVFRTGDEVVLFLQPDGARFPFVIGLSQGVFRIAAQPGSSARLVTPAIVMGEAGDEPQPVLRGDPLRRPIAWERFRDVVRQVMAEAGAR